MCVSDRMSSQSFVCRCASHGGLSNAQIQTQLVEAEASYAKWGFAADASNGRALYDHLFASAPIEWNRIGALSWPFLTRVQAHR